jgi:peptidoglycan/xylan/chitin deacetylase (PgdA/CDA1 family)
MTARLATVAVVSVLGSAAACGRPVPRELPVFLWEGEPEVGAMSMDHLDTTMDFPLLRALDRARDDEGVVMLYGHVPGKSVRLDVIEDVLAAARDRGLPFLTFADLAAGGPARPGINLSFDDDAIDAWWTLRDLFARYGARATFFVTRFDRLDARQRGLLHQLVAEGNDVQAHGVHHVNGNDYVAAHGIESYAADEVAPSLEVLRLDGFPPPVAFAHPYGAHTAALNAELLERVTGLRLIRSISRTPLPAHLAVLADGTIVAHPQDDDGDDDDN